MPKGCPHNRYKRGKHVGWLAVRPTCLMTHFFVRFTQPFKPSLDSKLPHARVPSCPARMKTPGGKYGIRVGGVRGTKQPMSEMVREASKGAGIHSIINTDYWRINHEIRKYRDHPNVRDRLKQASVAAHFKLTPFQIETIMRVVWRPRTTTKVDYKLSWPSKKPREESRRFDSPKSDIGSPVLVDLPPGTGKTIVCVLACFLIAVERCDKIPKQAAYTSSHGFTEVSVSERKQHGERVSMVFVPKHVHHQWKAAAEKAREIMGIMYADDGKSFFVGQNKLASKVPSANHDACVVICDSASFGLTKALERETRYAALCFDESTENCDATNNAIYSEVPHDLSYGRAIMISADFSKIADSNSKSASRPGSMLRRVFGDASSTHFQRAVQERSYLEHGRGYTQGDFDGGCKVVATLTTNAVFPANKREEIVDACADELKDVTLYTFGIKYKKSLLEVRATSPPQGYRRWVVLTGTVTVGISPLKGVFPPPHPRFRRESSQNFEGNPPYPPRQFPPVVSTFPRVPPG